jgi:hypothetical protein
MHNAYASSQFNATGYELCLGILEAGVGAAILAQPSLLEGAWGNRPRFHQSGARGRSALHGLSTLCLHCIRTDVLTFYWLRSHRLSQVDRLQRRHIVGIAGLETLPG